MKNKWLLLSLSILGITAASCSKDFLQRNPQTEISPEQFFKTPADLATYVNGFYDKQISSPYDDANSDNISSYTGSEMDKLVRGAITPNTIGGWDDWNQLRRVNFMLDNVYKTQGDPVEIAHYVAVARYFRAKFYFAKIATYSDVPWYGHALSDTDSSMYKARDPRAAVADSVLDDLQYAADHLKEKDGNGTRVNKYAALALMSRFGLFEGTFRKYHPELKLEGSADKFLNVAVTAAEKIMNSNKFSIYKSGDGAASYRALFVSTSLENNPEILQWRDYQASLGVGNNTHTVLGWVWSLSQSLANSYLMKDGTAFTAIAGYDKIGFVGSFANRDPRMAETIAYPGFSTTMNDVLYVAKPNLGGYDQLKFYPRDPALRKGWELNYTALPIYRFAEVLLNYAEAKAEQGKLTQSDIDQTINKLRSRVDMPAMNMATANSQIDPVLDDAYKNVTGANRGVILEIRRERRVETACEGLRANDVNRWAAGKLLNEPPKGMYVPAIGAIDMTGDDVPDIAILPSPTDTSSIANIPWDKKKNMGRYYLTENFYLENGTSGHIMFVADRAGREFKMPQYYYRPIPQDQIVLNRKLEQILGWEK
ncbi:MAG: RagB/SusD family nutrient uptake outer membrane protein [Chitinophaga sp.]|uniref:RagB/SusD family nutrient uptake outer membrane protein n=1 Tax=Chitinophaga sp. TaxID=1869181 RepID=UPI001B21EC8E|nr:RagB/SusD family nutrient uptake outer membrane protein [Chitinophaga sp.]MBO9728007.1 RagB/SusD family nutrient uptake outer membrane protein [Chitinophaga sp.]